MEDLADKYAAELEAQFRTLNIFVQRSGGEIGRAHESYVRTLLGRFLPQKYRVGTGFIMDADGVSTQQDVLIFNVQDHCPLYEVGDVSVVSRESAVGSLEVKVALKKEEDLREAVEKLASMNPKPQFYGLFAWEGLASQTILKVLLEMYHTNPARYRGAFPAFIYVRSRLVLIRNDDGVAESPPFRVMNLGPGGATDGQALLALVSTLWLFGLQLETNRPAWLSLWDERVGRTIAPMSMSDRTG